MSSINSSLYFLQKLEPSFSEKKILETNSACLFCYRTVPATIIEQNKKIFMERKCKFHHVQKILLENNSTYFKKNLQLFETSKFSASTWLFIPTKLDWQLFRKDCNSFLISITDKCNSNCNICYMDSVPHAEMSLKDIRRLLHKIGRNKNIYLFGGEPTVRKDIFKIIKLIKKSHNVPFLFTNGLKLTEFEFCRKLKEVGLEAIFFSLDGFTEYVHEKLRGDANQLYVKMRALKNLKELRIPVFISSTIVGDLNEDQVPLLLKFAVKNNDFIKRIVFRPVTPHGRVMINIEKIITPSDIMNLLEEATKCKIRRQYSFEFARFKKNILKILQNMRMYKPGGIFPTLYKIENDNLEELIPLEELKIFNKSFEKRNIFTLTKYFLRHIEWLIYFSKLLKSRKFALKFFGNNVIDITVTSIGELFEIPIKREAITLNKIGDEFIAYSGTT